MLIKELNVNEGTNLINRINRTRNRSINLTRPKFEYVDGRVTVLKLYWGSTQLGYIRAENRREAERISNSSSIRLYTNGESVKASIV